MGRPEPCVLFAHSFVHSQLDEYVDEVLFGEPVVVTGCEFLEQNASPSSSSVSLIGATSPPSFALEVFVHSEGESRFRRLCQPFLYSPSSSNVLEVEAVVTNHLVVRGTYRCLTLVVYGNTAEDLGQFRLGVELDDSLANLVYSSLEGKLEDLPPALRVINVPLEESISCSELSSLQLPVSDLSAELMDLLQLIFKIVQMHGHVNTICDVADAVVSVVSSYLSSDFGPAVTICNQKLCNVIDNEKDSQHTSNDLAETIDVLQELYKRDQPLIGSESTNISENEVQCKSEMANSEFLVYLFNQCFPSFDKEGADKNVNFHQNKSIFLRLGIIFLLCSTKQSCFWFVNSGGMVHLDRIFSFKVRASTAMTLLLLCVVEQATRYVIGCEGFLGWWPREDLNVPDNNSDGYCHLLNLLVQKQRHDVASLATYILHRLRSYEIAARYESAVLSLLTNLTADSMLMADKLHSLATTNSLLKNMLKLLNLRGPIEDPSYVASAKSSILGQAEGPLSYWETVDFIAFSKYSFSTLDIDTHLLPLLKERGFLALSVALLSSPILRTAGGRVMEVFVDIAASVELILLSLLSCRSGLRFLLSEPETVATLIFSLRGVEDSEKAEYLTLRHAAVLISKGFFCCPQEIGTIAELHLRVGNTIDRLLATPPHSEEQLWILWELCGISRSDSGRQALLAIGQHPEAVSVLIKALHSKDSEQLGLNTGSSPLSLAIFHSAAEIIEVIVMDSSATSLASWIQLAVDLHKALHSSSPGFNRKDAPTRVLEWIDAGVVYHRNGVIGLIRYAAILASGGDAHLSSGNVLVSDSMDVENVIGESNSTLDSLSVDNLLGKLVSDKYFDGVALHNTSVVQLTTTFRILAFISENRAVASSLFEEGSMTLIYVVLVNCRFMLERSSNTFDYLVDEGAECNSTSDLLLERSLEQTVAELLISCLVLLNNLLQRLHEAKEQYRNTKLLKALLRLHRELSPKVAACASDFSSRYPHSVLGLCTICRLIVSALACWPIFGWTPGLFHCLLESIQASSSLAMGPKDACSLLYLLGDLFPEEGIWLWKDGVPLLSAVRTLSVGTILGPEAERLVNWHLHPEHLTVLLGRLTPQLGKIAQIVLHFAFSALVAMQDMVRVFIIRICCLKGECADVLLNPIISCVDDHIEEAANLSEIDYFKVYRLLDFTARLLEHPQAKMLLPKIGIMNTVQNVLQHCYDAYMLDERLVAESRIPAKSSANLHSLCMPCFKLLSSIFSSCEPMLSSCLFNEYSVDNFDRMVTSRIMVLLHNFFKVLPVGRELVACLEAFKAITCSKQGRTLFLSNFMQMQTPPFEVECVDKKNEDSVPDMCDLNSSPPLLVCWKKLLRVLHMKDNSFIWAVEGVRMLAMCCLCLSIEGKNSEGVATLKSLFGFSCVAEDRSLSKEILEHLNEIVAVFDQKTYEDELLLSSTMKKALSLVKELVKSVISLLKQSDSSIDVENNSCTGSTSADAVSSLVPSLLPISSAMKTSECFEISSPFSLLFRSSWDNEKGGYSSSLAGLAEGFVWECADTAPDRLMMPSLPSKRRPPSEGSSRRSRDSVGPEAMGSNSFPRGVGATGSSSGPTRRDTFRQRKPNTSRPPSMHVDDYVARERNSDGVGGGINAVTSQRGGMTSGRPPSIHVDEFMARQKERHNSMAVTVGDAVQTRNAPPINGNGPEKPDKSLKLKADLDDDLQEINIVFDDESESDDRLPFLQPDDNLQPGPVIVGGNSPGSIVEENESDVNDVVQQVTTPPATEDGDSSLEVPLRRQSSLSDTAMALEKCASSEKNYPRQIKQKLFLQEQSAESKYVAPSMKSFDNMPPSSLGALKFYNVSPAPSLPPIGNSLISSTSKYPTDSPQKTANTSSSGGFQGYERKPSIGQPPLPPTPPPIFSSFPPQISQTEKSIPYIHSGRETQPPLPSGSPVLGFDVSVPGSVSNFHVYSERLSSMTGSSMPSTTTQTLSNSRYSWASITANNKMKVETYTSSSSASPLPPLPTTPPPSHLMTHTPAAHSGSQPSSYTQVMQLSLPSTPGLFSTSGSTLTTYSLPPFSPWQASISGTVTSSVSLQPGQNPPTIPQSITAAQSSVQSLQPRPPPPPPPPQAPRPSNHQNSRPSIQVSHISSEQVISLQSPIQVQMQPLHVQQQLQIPQIVYYQAQQQENLLQPPQSSLELPHSLQPQADSKSQQQDSGVTLQQYFSSPEAIQSLLSDRDKLCQLLEQHPKLMQMLQERLGQL